MGRDQAQVTGAVRRGGGDRCLDAGLAGLTDDAGTCTCCGCPGAKAGALDEVVWELEGGLTGSERMRGALWECPGATGHFSYESEPETRSVY